MSEGRNNTHLGSATLDDALGRLCEHLELELARQEAVLEACKNQDAAARGHDFDALEAATQLLTALMQEALDAEKARVALLREVVAPLGLPVANYYRWNGFGHVSAWWGVPPQPVYCGVLARGVLLFQSGNGCALLDDEHGPWWQIFRRSGRNNEHGR